MNRTISSLADAQGASSSLLWLDRARPALLDPETTAPALRDLVDGLAAARSSRTPGEWRNFVRAFREHPVLTVLHEDPYALRGFRKPRGYAGDAVLIDMIYGSGEGEPLVAKASPLGQRIYAAAMMEPGVAATRGRRDALAARIDELCRERGRPHILSVACGHLREAALSTEFLAGRVGRFVGLDQDRRSLRVVERESPGIECVAASISQLMDQSVQPGKFDFIYAAGLYDYLDQATGQQLLQTLARMLHPGGRILIANFLPDIKVAGYMEAAMDWWLIYRTPEQLLALADDLPACGSRRVFRDSLDHLGYLEMQFEG
ncbi:MAG TPA: class I SAM-dependent methyltransferase [Bryobacteraceae bacterium]|jgi:SAM-dependent methyltransferase